MITLNLPRRVTPRPPRRRSYAAASWSRLTSDWLGPLLSVDKVLEGSLRTLRGRARQLVRDNPHAARLVQLFQDNVAGPTGLTLQAQNRFANGRARVAVNDDIEWAWYAWSAPELCSNTGQLSCADLQRLCIANWITDGEILLRHRKAFPNPHGYAVQVLDPDLLDENYHRAPGAGVNEIRMGVEITTDGVPVAYHLLDRHPSEHGLANQRRRVPADEIIHVFRTLRPGQTRGVTEFAPVMMRLHMLDGFEEASLVAARISAASPIFFEQDAEVYQDEGDGSPETQIELEIEPGQNQLLPPGIKANLVAPEHPTTTFSDFERAMLRSIATGFGVAYSSLSGDLSDANYGSQRGGLLAERDVYRGAQCWFACHVLRPIYRQWLKHASLSGAVELPDGNAMRWAEATFEGRGWSWIDPLKDLQAAEKEIQLGLTSRTALARERGHEFEENLAQLAHEQELAALAGVDVSVVRKTAKDAADRPENPEPGEGDDRTRALRLASA